MNRTIRPGPLAKLGNEKFRFGAIVIFLVLVFLLGGGSRYDIQSLVLLRPLAILFIGYALILLRWEQIKRGGMPLLLLALLALLMVVQLVPLPPGLWSALPGREIFARIGELIGAEKLWRPLSLSPSRTLNSLLSLSVPFAAFLLFLVQDKSRYNSILWTIFGLATLSAILGLLQLSGPDQSKFYLYAITNNGSPVGLFANRNHHAIFLASLFPLALNAPLFAESGNSKKNILLLFSVAFVLFIAPLILAMGSRAGLGLTLAGLSIGVVILIKQQSGLRAILAKPLTKISLIALLFCIGAILYFAFTNSKSLAFDRLFGADIVEGSRYETFPYLIQLLWSYFPFGSGFGTFEFVYKAIEPIQLVRYSYLNQAHSDGIQIVIEAGIAGAAIVLAFLAWFAKRIYAAMKFFISRRDFSLGSRRKKLGYTATISVLIILVGSIMDYPLRVPSMMAYFAILCAWISIPGIKTLDSMDKKGKTNK